MQSQTKTIRGTRGRYAVSSDGKVFRVSPWNNWAYKHWTLPYELSQSVDSGGYPCVRLDGKKYRVHQLVASAFVPKPRKRNLEVNHIDGNKKDSSAKNLEWLTRRENQEHAFRIGLRKKGNRTKGFLAKLDVSKVLEIVDAIRDGRESQKSIAKRYCVSQTTISRVALGHTWSHVTGIRRAS